MKKFVFALIIILIAGCVYIFFSGSTSSTKIKNSVSTMTGNGPSVSAKSAAALDYTNSSIYYKKNEDEPLAIASISKLMTVYLAYDALQDGKLSWDETLTLEPLNDAQAVSLGRISGNTEYTVDDLMNATLVYSANDAAETLGYAIAKNKFVDKMNQTAKKLGMNDTKYVSASGLDKNGVAATSTAHDLLILSKEILDKYPEILSITKQSEVELSDGTYLPSTNEMLTNGTVKGVDGLKTGFTDEAGYCFIGTAKQNDKRMIVVVLGEKESDLRFQTAETLLKYGFDENK
ncbi:D-alanyl-D-alanine carboxypeptidase family protein [Listeria costaricensis]|uniref:D-alanyl-D-alanine carboxypeptidase family protein n=1 Tax=Listeria costaricensis TaxID=2026604 RepID=UPI0013C4ACAA|nr:D-alanyl-D-alanine carboxypeptidase family protein [Listeria costaricensis]